jgi:hemerythrin-like domain-containing protein
MPVAIEPQGSGRAQQCALLIGCAGGPISGRSSLPHPEISMIDDIEFLDDATRPKAPKLEGVTPQQREAGEHLKMIHDHLRDNMRVLRQLIERAAAGNVSIEEVAAETDGLVMLTNFRRFGTLCGQYCQFVHTHHSIEDQAIFPALSAKGEAFRKVSERLRAEHVVVHELLMRLVAALNALVADPGPENFAVARELYETMERVLLSHLGYEEDEIGDALGYFNLLG